MAEVINKSIHWIKLKIVGCKTNVELEHLKAAVVLAEKRTSEALQIGQFLNLDSRLYGNLQKVNETLGEFKKLLETVENICNGINAIWDFSRAVSILNEPNIIAKDPERAAKAFGKLFVSFGYFCEGPLKPYQEIFLNMGDFFDNLRYGLDPVLRGPSRRLADEMGKNKSVDPQILRF